MALTVRTLTRCGVPEDVARAHLPHMVRAMREFGIVRRPACRALIATAMHESMALRRMNEIGGGRRYEGRAGLGNRRTGDGERYKGRGPVQLTGRANYETYGRLLGLDLVGRPELVATPEVGWRVAACYFAKRPGLLAAANAGDFRRVTRLVNGGYNGWADRLRYWRILGPLGVVPGAPDLKKGARGREVATVTRRLARLKSRETGKPYLDAPRRKFDAKTARALRAFQREHALKADGVLDPATAAALQARIERAKPNIQTPAVARAAVKEAPLSSANPGGRPRPAVKLSQDRVARLWQRLERLDRESDRVRGALAAVGDAAPASIAAPVPMAASGNGDGPGAGGRPALASAGLSDAALVDALRRVDEDYDALRGVLASRIAERDGEHSREDLLSVVRELDVLSERVRAVASSPGAAVAGGGEDDDELRAAVERLQVLDEEAGTLRARLEQRLVGSGEPAGAARMQAAPGAVPAGAAHAGGSPAGTVPAGAALTGGSPAGTVPGGAVLTAGSPAGTMPAGAVLTAGSPAGSTPPGAAPVGAVLTSAAPAQLMVPDAEPATGPASPRTGRYLELLTRLDALDAESDRIRRILRAAATAGGPPNGNGNGNGAAAARKARTFHLTAPEMAGEDIRSWQREVNRRLRGWRIEYELAVDGEYGKETERWSRRILHGLGLSTANWHGVTPQLRVKARRPRRRTPAEVAAARRRRPWLRDLRRTHRNPTGVKAALAYAKRHADRKTAETRMNGGPFIDDWCRLVHLQPGTSYAHWCGAFANACLVEAGLPSRDWIRYTPSIVQNAKAGVEGWTWHTRPRVGDLVLFDWPQKGQFVDHVGIVAEIHGDGSITTVEGNFRNRVDYWRRKSQILGYARPPWKRAGAAA